MSDAPQLAPVVLTNHAVARFRERSLRALGVRYSAAAARKRICGLLARAKPDPWRTGQPKRLKLSGPDDKEYWVAGDWRFVVACSPSGDRALVTCERVRTEEN